jgi:hypothetical protein
VIIAATPKWPYLLYAFNCPETIDERRDTRTLDFHTKGSNKIPVCRLFAANRSQLGQAATLPITILLPLSTETVDYFSFVKQIWRSNKNNK